MHIQYVQYVKYTQFTVNGLKPEKHWYGLLSVCLGVSFKCCSYSYIFHYSSNEF